MKDKTPTAAWIETPTACYLVGKTSEQLPTHEEIEDARSEAMIEAQEEYEDQQEAWNE